LFLLGEELAEFGDSIGVPCGGTGSGKTFEKALPSAQLRAGSCWGRWR
jgi:hypothetical protein